MNINRAGPTKSISVIETRDAQGVLVPLGSKTRSLVVLQGDARFDIMVKETLSLWDQIVLHQHHYVQVKLQGGHSIYVDVDNAMKRLQLEQMGSPIKNAEQVKSLFEDFTTVRRRAESLAFYEEVPKKKPAPSATSSITPTESTPPHSERIAELPSKVKPVKKLDRNAREQIVPLAKDALSDISSEPIYDPNQMGEALHFSAEMVYEGSYAQKDLPKNSQEQCQDFVNMWQELVDVQAQTFVDKEDWTWITRKITTTKKEPVLLEKDLKAIKEIQKKIPYAQAALLSINLSEQKIKEIGKTAEGGKRLYQNAASYHKKEEEWIQNIAKLEEVIEDARRFLKDFKEQKEAILPKIQVYQVGQIIKGRMERIEQAQKESGKRILSHFCKKEINKLVAEVTNEAWEKRPSAKQALQKMTGILQEIAKKEIEGH